MKKLFLLLALTLGTSVLYAQENVYPYFAIETSDGVTVFPVEGLKLTFEDGNLVANSSIGQYRLELAKLTRMYFTTSGTDGIDGVEDGERKDGPARMFTLDGKEVRNVPMSGIYVEKKNGKTVKILKK